MARLGWLAAFALVFTACSSDDGEALRGDGGPRPGDAGVGEPTADAGGPEDARASDAFGPDGGASNPLCRFGGRGDQALGEPCGCGADCEGPDPICARELDDLLGEGYCSQACEGGTCPTGFQCLELGPLSLCQRCGGGEPAGLEEPCVCDADCGTVEVGGESRSLSCTFGQCAVTGCVPTTALGCPEGQFCELVGIDPVCVTCLAEAPRSEGDACACQRDCGGGLECAGGECRRLCSTTEDCDPGQECRAPALGSRTCVDPAPGCTGTATRTLGAPCVCNADCAPEAPLCLSNEIIGDVNVGFCTERPCSQSDPDACSTDGPVPFECCRVPLVFPPTCIPSPVADQLGGVLSCGP